MKIQDIIFLIMFVALLYFRKQIWFAYAGLASLLLAVPLFSRWVFFTAERLTWYAGAFFFASIIVILLEKERSRA